VARGRLSCEEALRAYRNSARKIFNLVFYGAALALTALYVALIVASDLPLGLNHPEPSAALMALVVPAILSVFAVHTLTSEPLWLAGERIPLRFAPAVTMG
jgi:uncharacterized membrane protein